MYARYVNNGYGVSRVTKIQSIIVMTEKDMWIVGSSKEPTI